MNDARAYGAPQPKLLGLALVGLLHVLVIYALVSGLARQVVDVVLRPVDVQVIQEVPPPPPPPPVVKQIVTQTAATKTPPPFVPPPEVQLAAPPPVPDTVTVSTPTPPPAPEPFKPSPPQPVVAPPAPTQPSVVALGVACPTRVVPRIPARLESVAGSVRARLTIRDGKVAHVEILSSSPRGVFDSIVRTAVLQYGCVAAADGQAQIAEQTFEFRPE